MKVYKTAQIGFLNIYTPDSPSSLSIQPRKNPHIVFSLAVAQENLEYIRKLNLADLGTVNVIDKQLILTVTSNRKIINAIDIFFKENVNYPQDNNKELYTHLTELKNKCVVDVNKKNKPKTLPLKSKLISKYEKANNAKVISSMRNNVYQVVKVKSPDKKFIYKENICGRPITEFEAFNGYCYRLLLGDRHPKVSPVHDENNNRVGFISELFPNFESLHDYYERTNRYPSEAEFMQAEVVKVWVASYLESENDLHGGNYGFGPDGYIVKIDDDQATWPLTSKYREVDTLLGHWDCKPPISSFSFSAVDIKQFPKLTKATPRNWPDRSDSKAINVDYFAKNKKFNEDKYYMMLKRLLIPRSVYEGIGQATISTDENRKKFVDYKCNVTDELKKALLTIPEFRNYVLSNPLIIQKIISEFSEYNKDFTKPKDDYLRVDINQIQNNFDGIYSEIYKKQTLSVQNSLFPLPPQQDMITRNNIINFLKANREFITGLLTDTHDFNKWIEVKSESEKDQYYQLYNDLHASFNDSTEASNDFVIAMHQINNNPGEMSDILGRNKSLCSTLLKHIGNPVIDMWYKDIQVNTANSSQKFVL